MCLVLFIVYGAWAAQAPPAPEFSADFFWKVIAAICTILVAVVSYQITRRDKLLDKIATTIFGDEEGKGLITRITVMESEISRCPGCSPGFHQREGDAHPSPHVRHPIERH